MYLQIRKRDKYILIFENYFKIYIYNEYTTANHR